MTDAIKREMRRRSAVEPVIGHAKSEHRMGRNYLAGQAGDAINAVLAAAGYNFRRLLAWFNLLLSAIWIAISPRKRPGNTLRNRLRRLLHGRQDIGEGRGRFTGRDKRPPLNILRARGVCGRFTQHYSWAQIYAFQSVIGVPQILQLCYNIAPRTLVDMVRHDAEGRRELARSSLGI